MTIQDEAGPQVPPAVGEFAIQERTKLISDNAGLRARLDKYEDAEGRPLQLSFPAEFLEHVKHARKELCRKETAPFHVRQRLAQKLTDCIAALKARPIEVALPDGWVKLTIEHEPGYPEDVAFGPQRMMDRLKKWLDRYFEMRLNSSPVSAGGELDVLREYRNASINFNNSHGVETESLEDAVEVERQAESRLEAAEKACWDFYAGRTQEPSHGEQVREGWQLVPVEATRGIEDAIGRSRNLKASEIWENAIAAAPSPASQEQG